jgi:hypothetical protein
MVKSYKKIALFAMILWLLPAIHAQDILVWDNDNNSDFVDPDGAGYVGCEYGIEQALEENGYDYVSQGYLPDDLSPYEVVFVTLGIWCTGCGSTPPGAVGSVEQQNLIQFLEAGKAIYVEGVDWGADHSSTELFGYFGVNFTNDGTNIGIEDVVGVEGTFTAPNQLEYLYGTDADYLVDELAPAGGQMLLTSQDEKSRVVGYAATEGYRTISSSVILGAMKDTNGTNTKTSLMKRYLMFLTGNEVPLLGLSDTEIDFGTTYSGYSSDYSLTLQNLGLQNLQISDLTISGDGFETESPSNLEIDVGGAAEIVVNFNSMDTGEFEGNLTFNTNDPENPTISINLHTTNLQPPDLEVTQQEIQVELGMGDSENYPWEISNVGNSDLNYSLELVDSDIGKTTQNIPVSVYKTLPKGVKDEKQVSKVIRDLGGPDDFGYQWIDSDAPAGPTYEWFDIADIGYDTGLTGDESTTNIELPFDFSFYGETKTSINVATNGYLSFGNGNSVYYNVPIPIADMPNDMIAPFWDDLHQKNGTCYVYYHEEQNRFIIQYDQWGFYLNDGPLTFQVILYENGTILFNYRELNGVLTSATVGIENSSGNDGLQVAYNKEYLHNQLSVQFSRGPRWLSSDVYGGVLTAGQIQNVNLTFDADNLEIGNYNALIKLSSNDPDEGLLEIPVTLFVTETANDEEMIPLIAKVVGNYPNPFNPVTKIVFQINKPAKVSLAIYNTKGQKIRSFASAFYQQGENSIVWNGKDDIGKRVSSGIYFYRISSGSWHKTQKMLMLK